MIDAFVENGSTSVAFVADGDRRFEGKSAQMSVYELNRAIHHVYVDRDKTMAFREGDVSVLAPFDLTDDERNALINRDFPKLWALHTHPVLLFHLSAVLNPREWYIEHVVPKIQGVPNVWYDYYPHTEATTGKPA